MKYLLYFLLKVAATIIVFVVWLVLVTVCVTFNFAWHFKILPWVKDELILAFINDKKDIITSVEMPSGFLGFISFVLMVIPMVLYVKLFRMKILKAILWLLLPACIVIWFFSHIKLQDNNEIGVCINKFQLLSRSDDKVFYCADFKMSTGEIREEHNLQDFTYYQYEQGKRYIFYDTKLVWK